MKLFIEGEIVNHGCCNQLHQRGSTMSTIPTNLTEMQFNQHVLSTTKRGESVAYRGCKRAKTTNILPITDSHGFIIASTGLFAEKHDDAFNLKHHLQTAFKVMKQLGLVIEGAFFNAGIVFDTKAAHKTCFSHGLIPNIAGNKRNRRKTKRGRKRLFNAKVYKRRFTSERSFAWIEKFHALLLRFERRDDYYPGNHYIVFAMFNLRHVIATQ